MAVHELAEDLEMSATATTSHHCQWGYKKVCHHHVCKCVRHWANDDWENELQEMAVHAQSYDSVNSESGDSIDSDASQDVVSVVF